MCINEKDYNEKIAIYPSVTALLETYTRTPVHGANNEMLRPAYTSRTCQHHLPYTICTNYTICIIMNILKFTFDFLKDFLGNPILAP